MKFFGPLATGKKVLTRGLWVLHCEYMKRSLLRAQFAVFRRQFSVPGGGGSLTSSTSHTVAYRPFAQGLSSVRQASAPATRHFRPRCTGAFTLIELLVVVAIIAILAGLTLATLGYVNKRGAESRARSEVAALSAAVESFKLDTGTYPSNAASLYTNLCPPTAGAKVYFEPTPGMATNDQFIDPWGSAYQYSNYTTYFELFTTNNSPNSNNWIRN